MVDDAAHADAVARDMCKRTRADSPSPAETAEAVAAAAAATEETFPDSSDDEQPLVTKTMLDREQGKQKKTKKPRVKSPKG